MSQGHGSGAAAAEGTGESLPAAPAVIAGLSPAPTPPVPTRPKKTYVLLDLGERWRRFEARWGLQPGGIRRADADSHPRGHGLHTSRNPKRRKVE